MSEDRALLLFLGGAAPAGWLRLRGGAVSARGTGAIPPDTADAAAAPERVYAIVPGQEVVLHWADLPALAPAQALAAARLLIGEVSAEPAERLHVAVGAERDGPRALAVASAEATAGWIGEAQALGYDPDHILPEPLLIAPADGTRRWTRDGIDHVRGPAVAFAAEPALAALALGDSGAEAIDDAVLEAGLAEALAALPVDLRQGVFARRRRWRIDLALGRRIAALAGLVLLATLAIQLALILRYSLAADRLERATALIAARALPGAAGADASAALEERLAGLRGGGRGFGVTASALFEAVRDSANVELSSLDFAADGSLHARLSAANAADLAAFESRVEASGFAVDAGPAEAGGGRQLADLTMRPR